jgi:hypothetical protein
MENEELMRPRTNSQQSIRIRTLENDASRLLAENLSLREQVVQLQNTLETQSRGPSFNVIDSVKDRLEAKMQELGSLVAELGQMKKKDDGSPRCQNQATAMRKSPDERQWRSALGLQEVENAMLPTITEDKFFPRKTIKYVALDGTPQVEEADDEKKAELTNYSMEEICDMDDSQSPDIGPPPVSRFDSENAIAFNPNPSGDVQTETAVEDGELLLPRNLETRRKRRESGPQPHCVFEQPREEVVEEPKKRAEEPQKIMRAGAKRKFSVQEDEDKTKLQAEPFRFSRRNTPTPSENMNSSEQPRPQSPDRQILGSSKIDLTILVISTNSP